MMAPLDRAIPAPAAFHSGATPALDSRLRGNDKVLGGNARLNTVATDFEALFIAQILKSARAAAIADDPLKSDGEDSFRALQDETTAKAIATAAPLGVARELARATAARPVL
jgi:Rod binding domain-containing protein